MEKENNPKGWKRTIIGGLTSLIVALTFVPGCQKSIILELEGEDTPRVRAKINNLPPDARKKYLDIFEDTDKKEYNKYGLDAKRKLSDEEKIYFELRRQLSEDWRQKPWL